MDLKRLFVFGNEYLEFDSLAKEVSDKLDNYKIIKCRSPEELLEYNGNITILDVVKNINEPILITDLNQLKTRNIISLHDFDLSYFLKLMKELEIAKEIKIIGIPQKGNSQLIAESVNKWI